MSFGVQPLFVSPPRRTDYLCEVCKLSVSASRADEIAQMWGTKYLADPSSASKEFEERNAKTDKLIAKLNRLGGVRQTGLAP